MIHALQRGMEIHFDKGTLVFKSQLPRYFDQNSEHAVRLNVLWDERTKSHRAPGYLYREIVGFLIKEKIPHKTKVFLTHKVGEWSELELRWYQKAALDRWIEFKGRGLVVIPTGGGKTRIAFSAMEKLKCATLCLVPTRVLMEQWTKEISNFYSGPIGQIGDGKHQIEAITVITFESAYRMMGKLGNLFKLLVIDEAHHFGMGMRDEALEMSAAPWRLGLSATPNSKLEVQNKIEQLIGPKVFEIEISALRGTVLANFESTTVFVDLTITERFIYEREMKIFKDFLRFQMKSDEFSDWSTFSKRILKHPDGPNALSAMKKAKAILSFTHEKQLALARLLLKYKTRKILIFTSDTEAALQISNTFLVAPFISKVPKKERERILHFFKLGLIKTIVSCRVLNEGIDVPDAEIAIVIGGSQGKREHIQRLGRLLRPSPGKKAEIFEIVCRNSLETRQSKNRKIHFD